MAQFKRYPLNKNLSVIWPPLATLWLLVVTGLLAALDSTSFGGGFDEISLSTLDWVGGLGGLGLAMYAVFPAFVLLLAAGIAHQRKLNRKELQDFFGSLGIGSIAFAAVIVAFITLPLTVEVGGLILIYFTFLYCIIGVPISVFVVAGLKRLVEWRRSKKYLLPLWIHAAILALIFISIALLIHAYNSRLTYLNSCGLSANAGEPYCLAAEAAKTKQPDWCESSQNFAACYCRYALTALDPQYCNKCAEHNVSYCFEEMQRANVNIVSAVPEASQQNKAAIVIFTDFDQALEDPRKVRALSIQDLSTIPPSIARFSELEELYISSDHITTLPPEIGHLKKLKALNLGTYSLVKFPTVILQLSNLEQLNINGTNITSLPPEIARLQNLLTLDIGWTQITNLPEGLNDMPKLEIIGIQGLSALKDPFASVTRVNPGIQQKFPAVKFVWGSVRR